MKTKHTKVTQKMSIWAIPKSDYDLEDLSPGEMPFDYKIFTNMNTPWQDGSVKVDTQEVDLWVPAGVDLLEQAIETLKEQIKETRAEAQSKITKYEQQIEQLTLIEYKPIPGGELI